jgi:hypothetical protein
VEGVRTCGGIASGDPVSSRAKWRTRSGTSPVRARSVGSSRRATREAVEGVVAEVTVGDGLIEIAPRGGDDARAEAVDGGGFVVASEPVDVAPAALAMAHCRRRSRKSFAVGLWKT